ncbi:ABC-type Fe3+-hydroxamate transport system, substrate-binding protein [Quadrisphaera granulorum]|uniref:ABC-type Fe3+-hydroxamate transport system substrate-binding protein n=1 Tax=Quadrisphaera granulorum TaxID=317664 RepID=A0A315ZQ55_9ACTN|nr:ABC transporter substrate-binding protein [Quadrisphaera granulorum]PWJ47725.1 ABC-type Fe3+-hydroxamate transport system substrate-binding protein [Quadrisphaera granulorum]SZE98679.1 ABC-type Fe3+-hydroxamate transport system, substrate-binding protein [Quadrisphaera granulorum]
MNPSTARATHFPLSPQCCVRAGHAGHVGQLGSRHCVLAGAVRRTAATWPTGPTRRSLLRVTAALAATGSLAGASGCGLAGQAGPSTQEPAGTASTVPSRVMAMYATEADHALVLGLPVVAAYSPNGKDFPPYQGDRLKGATPISSYPEPDLDAITSAEPDLILVASTDLYEPDVIDMLRKIAPVRAMADDSQDDWPTALRGLAELVDRTDVAEQFIADYDARSARLRERVQERWGGSSFAYVGPLGGGQFWVGEATMLVSTILHEEMGLPFASAVPPSIAERRLDISYEELSMLEDADLLLVRTNPDEGGIAIDTAQLQEFQSAPLWDRLPAVAAGHVFLNDVYLYYTSPLTAQANLDWIENTLLA